MKIYFIIFSLFFSFLFSCTSEEENKIETDEYSIRYVIKANDSYSYFNAFSIKTDFEELTFNTFNKHQLNSWTQTYYGVKKGFKALATATGEGAIKIEIYVSKNNEEFVLKASKLGYAPNASYTIDF